MKIFFIATAIILVLLLACVYWFIPNPLTVSDVATLHSSVRGANRVLLQKENWKKFWPGAKVLMPGTDISSNDLFLYNEDTFRVTGLLQNALSVDILSGDMHVNSSLVTLPLNPDSIALNWSYTAPVSSNPFARIRQYNRAVRTKKNMEAVMQKIQRFLSNDEDVYGISIAQTTTQDTILVSTYGIFSQYPATDDIYNLIKKLQHYIHANDAEQTGNPMLNITKLDSQQYKMMVAVPTNKILKEGGDISYKRMIPGRFLTATVTGGNEVVNNAYQQMQYYFDDYQRISMAIPFQVLVTDRSMQTDTTQWITKLYFPVM